MNQTYPDERPSISATVSPPPPPMRVEFNHRDLSRAIARGVFIGGGKLVLIVAAVWWLDRLLHILAGQMGG